MGLLGRGRGDARKEKRQLALEEIHLGLPPSSMRGEISWDEAYHDLNTRIIRIEQRLGMKLRDPGA